MQESMMRLGRSLQIAALLLLSGQACVKVHVARGTDAPPALTTIVVVRHAEKSTDDPRDPSISAAGLERAEALRETLKDAGVGAIYATQLKRTRQTAEPLARKLGLTIIERSATAAATDLASEILRDQSGKTILIVGHSNTVPQIVQAFGRKVIPPIQDSEYDHLFIVTLAPGRAPQVVSSRYGRATQ